MPCQPGRIVIDIERIPFTTVVNFFVQLRNSGLMHPVIRPEDNAEDWTSQSTKWSVGELGTRAHTGPVERTTRDALTDIEKDHDHDEKKPEVEHLDRKIREWAEGDRGASIGVCQV